MNKGTIKTHRKNHQRTGRILSLFFATILTVLSILSVAPFQAAAAPEESSDRSSKEEISVLSVMVNINTETEQVFTELILHNESGEEKEVTFSLPKISAGMNFDTLKVKTTGGSDMETDNGVVTLSVSPGGNAVLSYNYEPKRKLVYEGTIGFDLKQLTKNFSDRIGHLEWTVDLPTSELVLVKEIHPVNYTVADNRIRVVLENFRVTSLLDRVWISRTTHAALLEEIDQVEERLKSFVGEEDVNESDWRYSEEFRVARFIVSHYRKWYRLPEETFERVEFGDSHGENHSAAFLLFRLYLQEEYPEEDVSILTSEEMIDKIGGEGTEKHEIYKTYYMLRHFVEWIPDPEYNPETYVTMFLDVRSLLRGLFKWNTTQDETSYHVHYNPAFAAQMYPGEPRVYAVLLSDPLELKGRELLAENMDYDHELFLEIETFVPASEATWLPYIAELNKGTWHQKEQALTDKYQACRIVCITEEDFEDSEAVLDYLNALHVRAVERLQMLSKNSEVYRDFLERSGAGENDSITPFLLSYDGTDRYSVGAFSADLTASFNDYGNHRVDYQNWEITYLMGSAGEPLKERLSVPIFTHYVGYYTPVEQFVAEYKSSYEYRAEFHGGPLTDAMVLEGAYMKNPILFENDWMIFEHALSESAVPKRMIEEHLQEISAEENKIKEKLDAAREELKPAAREELIPEPEPETSEPESDPEEPTDSSEKETQETTEEPASTELSSEDDGTGQTVLTPPPTPTAGAPTPAPLPWFQAMGGGTLIAIIAAFVVGLLATIAVIVGIVIQNKKRNE